MAKKYSMKGGGAKFIGFVLVVIIVISLVVYFKYFRDDEEVESSASGANTNAPNTNAANANTPNANAANANAANTNPANTNPGGVNSNVASTSTPDILPCTGTVSWAASELNGEPCEGGYNSVLDRDGQQGATNWCVNAGCDLSGDHECTGTVTWPASQLNGMSCEDAMNTVVEQHGGVDAEGAIAAGYTWCVTARGNKGCTLTS